MKTLRSKFIFWICLLFILMGVLIFLPLSIILPERITSQILKRDISIAQYLSREVQEPLLVDNKLVLKLLLEDRLENLPDAIYLYIRGRQQEVIASTFKEGFPRGLLNINPAPALNIGLNYPDKDMYSIKEFLAGGKKVYDIAIPLLQGELGSLHVGVSLESSKAEIAAFSKIKYYVAIVIFIGLGAGILVFALLGIFLSNRIIKLKDFALKIGSGDLRDTINIKTNDEIGALASAFNEMVRRLREKIEEINRLSIIKERDRIAFDLHDGCAQNMAHIIKRIELCEKLFAIDPHKAIDEMSSLKEVTRDILTKTRQIIFDLKLLDNPAYSLLDNIKKYIEDFQKENEISVGLNVSGAINNISSVKSGHIFYIISEAFTNIKRHSQAKNAQLRMECHNNNELAIIVKDDGKGFDVDSMESTAFSCGKLGLMSMRQRADSLGGRLLINSKPGQGTEVLINIPLKEEMV